MTVYSLLTHLLEDIRQHVGCLFQLSADVAELDLVLSLAQISCNPEYVQPSFDVKLELRDSLHPIMELFNTDLPVSNDVVSVRAATNNFSKKCRIDPTTASPKHFPILT